MLPIACRAFRRKMFSLARLAILEKSISSQLPDGTFHRFLVEFMITPEWPGFPGSIAIPVRREEGIAIEPEKSGHPGTATQPVWLNCPTLA